MEKSKWNISKIIEYVNSNNINFNDLQKIKVRTPLVASQTIKGNESDWTSLLNAINTGMKGYWDENEIKPILDKYKPKLLPKNNIKPSSGYSLPDLEVYASDTFLGNDATYDEFYNFYRDLYANQAVDKYKYSLGPIVPFKGLIDGPMAYSSDGYYDVLSDSIESRESRGFYQQHPNQRMLDYKIRDQYKQDCSGYSCANSVTSMFGDEYRNMNNIQFKKNPQKNGFIRLPDNSLENKTLKRGDVIQYMIVGENRPQHMVMFDSYIDGGIKTYDNHGSIIPYEFGIEHNQFFQPYGIGGIDRYPIFYRFVGNSRFNDNIKLQYELYKKRNNTNE